MIDRRRTLKPSLQHGQPTHLAAATHAAGTWHANWAQTRSAAADRPYPWWGDTNHHRCMGGKAAARDTASAVSGCNSASQAALAAHAHDADGHDGQSAKVLGAHHQTHAHGTAQRSGRLNAQAVPTLSATASASPAGACDPPALHMCHAQHQQGLGRVPC